MNKTALFFSFLYILLVKNASAQDSSRVNYDNSVSYIIAGINIVGDAGIDNRIVANLSGLRPGQKIAIPGEDITLAIQSLWKQQLFSDVKIKLDSTKGYSAWLSIHVKSRPRLAKYTFAGIPKSQAKKISEEVKLTPRDIVTEHLITTTVFKIKDFYMQKGFPNAKVKIEPKADTTGGGNNIDLVFRIDRGKRMKINEIVFEGNNSYSEKKLQRLMKKTKEKQLLNVFRNSKYKDDEYETDKQSLLNFYRKNGYKDVQIVVDSSYFVEENLMNIYIKLSEGKKYYFRNIQWTGNTKYDSRFLSAILGIKRGDIYNPEMLERNLYISQNSLDVTSLYMDDGYLFFSVTPVEVQVDNDSVDLEIRIFEGPQATINKVTVSGNTKTHDHVILRELRTKPGQKFSRSDIIRSQRELSQLGYFDPEKMGVSPKPNPRDGTVDIEYTVVEKPSDQIELSGGWGAGRLVGVLGLSLNNFSIRNTFNRDQWQGYPSGDGQRLSIRAQTNGPQFQSYNLSFTEPWFGGKQPNSFTFSAFYSVQRYGNLNVASETEMLATPGVSIGLGRRMKWPDDWFTEYLSLSYQYYTFQNFTLVGRFNTGYSNNLNLRYLIQRNSSNYPIYPTGGSNLTFQLQLTPPYSLFWPKDYSSAGGDQKKIDQIKYDWIEYHKWKFDAAYYFKLWQPKGSSRALVLTTAANFGIIGLYNSQLGLTPFERFYVGGDGLAGFTIDGRELIRLRGYESFGAVTPTINDLGGQPIENGATVYNRFTFELRYPITTSEAATIYGLAFLEGGNAQLRFKDYNPFQLKRSAGVGIRAFLPMFGLLGFDWGYGFDRPLNAGAGPLRFEDQSHFHFYIGQPLGF